MTALIRNLRRKHAVVYCFSFALLACKQAQTNWSEIVCKQNIFLCIYYRNSRNTMLGNGKLFLELDDF